MPRLTREQAIDYYGRNLPTPTIDKIVLSDVPEKLVDDIKADVAEAVKGGSSDVSSEEEVIELISDATQIDVHVSFVFSTDENFKIEDFEKTLFDIDGADESLYITLHMSEDFLLQNESIFKTDIITNFVPSPAILDLITSDAYIPGTVDYTKLETVNYFAGISTEPALISVPLSDFKTTAELTSEIDTDGNSVIRVANIKITTYIKNFRDKENLNVFCGVSSKHPYDIKGPTDYSLDPITISMSYSDISYEAIIKNGTLAIIGEPVFVDSQGIQYPSKVLAAIDKKYYKTEKYGSREIFDSIQALINEYKTRALQDEELQDFSDQIQTVLMTYQNNIDLLQNLNKAAQGFSVTNSDSGAIGFTQRLRVLINNADAVLRLEEEVVKRIFRNYKIVDSRTFETSGFNVSYVDSLGDRDFLYQDVFNTNIANYVPMATADVDYPGKAELPATPSEMIAEYSEELLAIRRQLEEIMIPFTDSGAITRTVKEHVNNAVTAVAEWCFNDWAAKFIKGSAHEKYQNSPANAGAHYYIVDVPMPEHGQWNWAPDRDNYEVTEERDDGPGGGGSVEVHWDPIIGGAAPYNGYLRHWQQMVVSTTPPTYDWSPAISIDESTDESQISSRTPWRITQLFGYYPNGTDRPDNSPRRNAPTYKITHAPRDVVGWTRTWYWFDPYFWTATSVHAIEGLYALAQQEHQIEFYVPSKVGNLADLMGLDAVTDGELTVTDEIEPESGAYSYDLKSLQYEYALVYMGTKYDKIGGLQAIYPNSITNHYQKNTKHPISYYDIEYARQYAITEVLGEHLTGRLAVALTDAGFSTPGEAQRTKYLGWWKCARIKYSEIHAKVKEIFYNLYGLDPDTLDFVAGTGALIDGGPAEDTVATTDFDTILSEGPARIVEKCLSEILAKIDNRPADDFDTESERNVAIALYTNELMECIAAEAESYYDKKYFKIYAVTSMPQEPVKLNPVGGIADAAVYPRIGIKDLTIAGTSPHFAKNIAYGKWGALASSGANVYAHNFGQDFINLLVSNVNARKEEIRSLIDQYISRRALFTGFRSDVGVHSALAEVDIVLSKYGYFFFDMEKYIRKKSHLSRVINVDRMLKNLPSARFMTNAACRLKEVSVELDNLNPLFDGFYGETFKILSNPKATITLTKDQSSPGAMASPTDFTKLQIESPLKPSTGNPFIYRKIKALQGISFDQITDYTFSRDEEDYEEGTPERNYGEYIRDYFSRPGLQFEDLSYLSSTGLFDMTPSTSESVLGTTGADNESLLNAYEGAIRNNEVDIESLTLDSPSNSHRPKELYTNLVMRNYAFPGFSNLSLAGGQTWRRDYRLMMFRYQFFMDDDDAFGFTGGDEFEDSSTSYDNIKLNVKIIDRSHKTFIEMIEQYATVFTVFESQYYSYAEESCAFNSFDQNFNRFFVDKMLEIYPSPPDTPWHQMIAFFITYKNMLTEDYNGDQLLMFEDGDRLLEGIRPETGDLRSLRNFRDSCSLLLQELQDRRDVLLADSPLQTEFEFTYEDIIGAKVIDHIGDYSDRLEDPRISEFGGDEDLYDYEDF